MKRIIAAVLLASMTLPALAQTASGGATASGGIPGFREGLPYSQLDVDRALPNVKDPVIDQPASAGATEGAPGSVIGFQPGLPYEQELVDRALPSVKDPVVTQPSVQVAGPATDGFGSSEATGPWANDWNFIAPAP
jgi:hypothetical protein